MVGDETGFSRVEHLNLVFQFSQEERIAATDEFGDAVAGEKPTTVSGGVDTSNQPFFVADDNAGARGESKHAQVFRDVFCFFLEGTAVSAAAAMSTGFSGIDLVRQ
ncbi:hypothetical protein CQA4T8M7_41580 [Sphaerotilus natans]|nr:hypothetical protein CQA4T8M7_41580 [Sphaerotilus natans]